LECAYKILCEILYVKRVALFGMREEGNKDKSVFIKGPLLAVQPTLLAFHWKYLTFPLRVSRPGLNLTILLH
jgi:hypothetical protein